jgi:RNA polymerase sigma factor (sigma-70 family)
MDTNPILYVEDEPDYQVLVSGILSEAGIFTEVADTGEDGMEKLSRRTPSLLLLDVNLPDTSGYDLCSRIRQEEAWADLPIVMLTVRGRPNEWLEGFSKGADDYLSKPFNPPELIERVQSILNGKRDRRLNSDDPEHLLIEAALAGNRRAFEVLITQYRMPLLHSVRRLADNPAVAEDIVAAAFSTAYETLGRFNGNSSFFTWLYGIADNQIHTEWRSHSVAPLVEFNEEHPARSSHSSVSISANQSELYLKAMRKLDRAITSLPADYRTPVRQHCINEVPVEDLARQLKLPVGTVLSRIHRGKALLRKIFRRYPKPEAL